MSKHTPGPWKAIIGNHDTFVRLSDGGEFYVGCEKVDQSLETIEANALLIAYAPDLLKICKDILALIGEALIENDFYDNSGVRALFEKAQEELFEVIKKAEGD
jgi:hypothetical protein